MSPTKLYGATLPLFVALLLCCAPALAQTPTAQQTAAQELAAVMTSLERVVAQLAIRNTLTSAQTDTLRRDLAGVYTDLERVQLRLGGTTPPPETENRADVWTRFGNATVTVSPSNARFTSWTADNSVELNYGDAGELLLNVRNSNYTSAWRLRDAYVGAVRTTITTQSNGDIQLRVNDTRGTHEFLVKDGGIGPIYTRGLTVPDEAPFTPERIAQGVWFRAYRDAVQRGELQANEAMDWLIMQYQDNSFASVRLREFGVMLSELEGQPLRTNSIATMRFNREGREVALNFPDPRRSPAEFAVAAAALRELQLANRWFELNLTP